MSDNQKLYFDDGGQGGVPVVFLHSLAGHSGQWAAQLNHVRKTRRAIAIDLPGHGQSTGGGNLTIDSLAEAVHGLVGSLDMERFVLVGHSMGGAVAAAYAGAYPQDVAGLLLVDPSGDSTQMPRSDVDQIIGAMESDAYPNFIEGYWQQILTGSTEATRTAVLQDLRSTPKETIVSISKSLFNYNPAAALREYNGPKLSVITPINETPIGLHNLLPELPHRLITETGHWLHMDKQIEFNEILDDFLAIVLAKYK